MSPVRAIPTSRAYWELRAEQVLNRVFAPEAPIDVEVCETASSAPAAAPAPTPGPSSRRPRTAATPRRKPAATTPQAPGWWKQLQGQPSLVLAAASVLVTVTAGTTLLGLSLWQQSQQAIRQERNMLLVERLRAMGPAAGPQTPATTATTGSDGSTATLPAADPNQLPPPPTEPWMEELASLPASSAPPANVLRVPMNGRVGSPAPPASGRAGAPAPSRPASGSGPAPAGDLPQLVGVVQVPGRPGSAIFQVEGSSTSAAAGESIGSSGWRLQSASGDSAVIERNGVQQRISISSGL